jgi:hypothetical protein
MKHTKPLAICSPSTLSQAELVQALDGHCDQERLLRGIRDLLGIYWQPTDAPEERARQGLLFVRDLAEFSDDVVGWAVSEWRRTMDRRPSIASLRQLAMRRRHGLTIEAKRRNEPVASAGPSAVYEQLTDAERDERRAAISGILQQAGYQHRRTGWVSPGLIAEERAAVEAKPRHWSETAAPDDPRWAELRRARAANALMQDRPE